MEPAKLSLPRPGDLMYVVPQMREYGDDSCWLGTLVAYTSDGQVVLNTGTRHQTVNPRIASVYLKESR